MRREIKQVPESEADPFSKISPAYDIQKAATPADAQQPGYYGLPILKRPFWRWEIAGYFFSEGISAGSYILCAMADFAGRDKLTRAIRNGRWLALATLLPCPPLLIGDLGRPERFHYMLRMFKRTSPMNHGAWALTFYGAFSGLSALLELPWFASKLARRLTAAAGLPFALTMVSYPGVLLETTAIPVWAKTNFLGPLFAASSLSTAAAALTLANGDDADETLVRVEDIAAAVEAAALAAYVGGSTRAVRPLLRGKQAKLFIWGGVVAGLALPFLLRRSKRKAVRSVAAPLLTLAGGLALKWSITYAGQESAADVEMAVHNSPSKTGQPFWGPADESRR